MTQTQPRLFRVKAHPAAKNDRLEAKTPGVYEVWVRAPAEAGRANDAVLDLLSRELRVERKRLRIIKGATSPSKLIQILGDYP
ncbi:MAG: DUF167 domain-containing protein [Elusimicrobia bacterium]|nr:DUF167 domain-containing protein [Elusimicrobiota bacterium]